MSLIGPRLPRAFRYISPSFSQNSQSLVTLYGFGFRSPTSDPTHLRGKPITSPTALPTDCETRSYCFSPARAVCLAVVVSLSFRRRDVARAAIL